MCTALTDFGQTISSVIGSLSDEVSISLESARKEVREFVKEEIEEGLS
jgi:hypothetical protein